MLCITRKIGEKVFVICPDGTEIEITAVDADRGKIRIGVKAPKDYAIARAEIVSHYRKKKEQP